VYSDQPDALRPLPLISSNRGYQGRKVLFQRLPIAGGRETGAQGPIRGARPGSHRLQPPKQVSIQLDRQTKPRPRGSPIRSNHARRERSMYRSTMLGRADHPMRLGANQQRSAVGIDLGFLRAHLPACTRLRNRDWRMLLGTLGCATGGLGDRPSAERRDRALGGRLDSRV